jgi:hypothetical protein
VALPGGPYTKVFVGWYLARGVDRETGHAHYRKQHADLVRELAGPLRLARYVQNVNLYNPLIERLSKEQRGTIPDAFDGFDEYVWLRDDLVRALDAPEGRAAAAAIVEDEAAFADRATSPSWFSVERIIY